MGLESLLGGGAAGPIGLAAGLIPQIGSLIFGGKQRREAKKAAAQADQYFGKAEGHANNVLDYAKQNYATAQNAYNGSSPGSVYQEGNIQKNQAGTLASLGRNATDSSQLLSLAGAVQGNTNDAYNQLAQNEQMNKLYQQQNLTYANMGVQGGENNLQNLDFGRSQMANQAAAQLGQSATQNTGNGLNGIGNLGVMLGTGAFGKFGSEGGDGYSLGGQSGGMDSGNYQLPYGNIQPNLNFNLPLHRFKM